MQETVAPSNRLVMLNIHVADLRASRHFYEALLEIAFAEERHGDGPVHLNAAFGEWNTASWFLVSLWPDADRAGAADIGLLVADLDSAHRRALETGGTEISGPREQRGMPRNAQVRDPSGNHIGLYQA
jgi:predicted enzyme related to lactoylglutathione lyase